MRTSTRVFYITAATEQDAIKLAWAHREEPIELVLMAHRGELAPHPSILSTEALARFGRLFRVRVGVRPGLRGYPEPVSDLEELPLPPRATGRS